MHTLERLGHGQHFAGLEWIGLVAAALGPHLLHSAQDGVVSFLGDDVEPSAFPVISTVMACPFLAKDLPAPTVLVVVAVVAVAVLGPLAVARDLEAVGGGAQPDDGTAAVEIVNEVLHLPVRPVLEAGEDHHQVGGLEGFHPRDVRSSGHDLAFLVHSEEDGALESVVSGKDAGKGREGLFGSVFVVAGNEDEVRSLTRTGLAPVCQGTGEGGREERKE